MNYWLLLLLIPAIPLMVVGMVYGSTVALNAWKMRLIKNTDRSIKKFYDNVDSKVPESVLDATPREVIIGEGIYEKLYLIRPLKYKQLLKLISVFGGVWSKLKELDWKNDETAIKKVLDMSDDEMLEALATLLYMNEHPDAEINRFDIEKIEVVEGFLRNQMQVNQFKRIIDVVVMQNDVTGIIETITGHKKKLQTTG